MVHLRQKNCCVSLILRALTISSSPRGAVRDNPRADSLTLGALAARRFCVHAAAAENSRGPS